MNNLTCSNCGDGDAMYCAVCYHTVGGSKKTAWNKTTDGLPEKPGLKHYEHVLCWVFIASKKRGYVEMLAWNCEHECWDDIDMDDHSGYSVESISHWMPMNVPKPPDE